MYYECHIIMQGDKDKCRKAVKSLGWKFFSIDGDIHPGDGINLYATHHYKASVAIETVINIVNSAVEVLSISAVVVRKKVELVIYDDKP